MVRSRRNWLERSGQAWKLTLADVGLFSSLVLIVGGVALRKPGVTLAGLAVGILGVVLPFVVRCAVCRVRLMRSEEARTLPRGYRGDMLRSLEVCPVCRDDGSATPDSVAAWAGRRTASRTVR